MMNSSWIFGGIAAATLFAFAKHRRHQRWAFAFPAFSGGPCGRGDFGGHWGRSFGRHGRGFGRHGFRHGFGQDQFLHHLFARLETTHGQEEVLKKEWEALQTVLRNSRKSMQASADTMTRAFAGETFDRAAIEAQFPHHEDAAKQVRAAVLDFVERAHGVLDARQREQVADFMARMQAFRRGF